MNIIVDVNIILSALIRDSSTRRIILSSNLGFSFPEPSLHKIRKYQDYIIKKSGLSKFEYLIILNTLLKYITIIPTEKILSRWDEAKRVMEHIDQEDVVFIATALGLKDSVIWSDDKDFEKQKKIRIFKTKEIARLFL